MPHWQGRLSAETAPHYFALTDEAVLEHGPDAKMNPPLRSEADREAVAAAVAEGLLSVIATDHAPHAPAEKALGLERAPFGVVGLETALASTLSALPEGLTLPQRLLPLTATPARVLGLPAGGLTPGAPADLVIIEPHTPWTVEPSAFLSRGRNTPFAGETLTGRVWGTVVGASFAYREGKVMS